MVSLPQRYRRFTLAAETGNRPKKVPHSAVAKWLTMKPLQQQSLKLSKAHVVLSAEYTFYWKINLSYGVLIRYRSITELRSVVTSVVSVRLPSLRSILQSFPPNNSRNAKTILPSMRTIKANDVDDVVKTTAVYRDGHMTSLPAVCISIPAATGAEERKSCKLFNSPGSWNWKIQAQFSSGK